MNLRRALLIAACMILVAAGPAVAQFGPPPQQQQQGPPCLQEFMKLRDDAQKKGAAIKTASERKASPKEACQLFNVFSTAEIKMVKYASDNAVWCGIPPEVVTALKQGHVKTLNIRGKVCQAAAAGPPPPSAPSLSDALAAPVPDSNNIRTGRGTFDTLTGSPLGKQ